MSIKYEIRPTDEGDFELVSIATKMDTFLSVFPYRRTFENYVCSGTLCYCQHWKAQLERMKGLE